LKALAAHKRGCIRKTGLHVLQHPRENTTTAIKCVTPISFDNIQK